MVKENKKFNLNIPQEIDLVSPCYNPPSDFIELMEVNPCSEFFNESLLCYLLFNKDLITTFQRDFRNLSLHFERFLVQ